MCIYIYIHIVCVRMSAVRNYAGHKKKVCVCVHTYVCSVPSCIIRLT